MLSAVQHEDYAVRLLMVIRRPTLKESRLTTVSTVEALVSDEYGFTSDQLQTALNGLVKYLANWPAAWLLEVPHGQALVTALEKHKVQIKEVTRPTGLLDSSHVICDFRTKSEVISVLEWLEENPWAQLVIEEGGNVLPY
jgi:hypothetical protein